MVIGYFIWFLYNQLGNYLRRSLGREVGKLAVTIVLPGPHVSTIISENDTTQSDPAEEQSN